MSASRREFLKYMLSTAAAVGAVSGATQGLHGKTWGDGSSSAALPTAPNLLLMVNDEERHWDMIENLIDPNLLGAEANAAPGTFRGNIPARMRLRNNGVRFSNYYTPTAPCSPARSVMYTGHHAPDTQVVDNMDFEPQASLKPAIPTMADVLGKAGYYCAYKGKVHLAKDSDLVTARDMLQLYGFHDWQGPYRITDSEGPQSGAKRDKAIAGYATQWLAQEGKQKSAQRQPWLLAVNFINPHDVMLVDIDGRGKVEIKQGDEGGYPLVKVPTRHPYYYWWNPEKPQNFSGVNGYSTTTSGPRPQMLDGFAGLLSAALGNIPLESTQKTPISVYRNNAQPDLGTKIIKVPMWQAYINYYLNCIIDNDSAMASVLDALAANGLQDSTLIIYTADHGEFAMSHMGNSRYYDEALTQGYEEPDLETFKVMPLRQKGPFVYEENNNVPFVVSSISVQAQSLSNTLLPVKGVDVPALASSVDLLPTLMYWAGRDAPWYKSSFGATLKGLKMLGSLPGVSLAEVIRTPNSYTQPQWSDGANGRQWVLFTADNISCLDADYAYHAIWGQCAGKTMSTANRGILRGYFDGRYKYARYFSPEEYELNGTAFAPLDYPALIAAGVHGQDIQLFDLQSTPYETFNAAKIQSNRVKQLNSSLCQAMAAELYSRERTPDTVRIILDGGGNACGS